MQDKHEWRTGRHAVFELYVHLVFTTKCRRKVFTDSMLKRLEEILREKCSEVDANLIEFNGETEHVHLLVNFPARISVSELVRLLKGVSSRLIRQEFWDDVKSKLWGDHFWSPSYCAVTAGGAPLEIIKQYIQDQHRPATENQKKMSLVANKRWGNAR